MSTKNISRSAIEGGRSSRNKFERRRSSQAERINTRLKIATTHNDGEALHDAVMPTRIHVYKEFSDKLSPVYRWLDSHVGESWNDVRALLTSQFDTRTTAGRHVFYDHIIGNVMMPGDIHDYNDYYVDDNGFLQKRESWRRRFYQASKRKLVSVQRKHEILEWMGVRRIGMVGGTKMYWYEPTKTKEKVVVTWGVRSPRLIDRGYWWTDTENLYYYTERRQYKSDGLGGYMKEFTVELSRFGVPSYRQGKEFTSEDILFFEALPEWLRANLLKTSSRKNS